MYDVTYPAIALTLPLLQDLRAMVTNLMAAVRSINNTVSVSCYKVFMMKVIRTGGTWLSKKHPGVALREFCLKGTRFST